MKKALRIYTILLFALFVVFSTVYYASYRNISMKYGVELREMESNIAQIATQADAIKVNMADTVLVSRKMTYISEMYDSVSNTVTEALETIPDEWIGLSREELISRLSEYDYAMTLVSFSEDRLVVRESRTAMQSEYRYYMVLQEGFLVVYYADKQDVFLDTDITFNKLPLTEKERLKKDFYVKHTTELYDYLESITD